MDYAALAVVPTVNFAALQQQHDRKRSFCYSIRSTLQLGSLRGSNSKIRVQSKWNVGFRSSRQAPRIRVPRPVRASEGESEPEVPKVPKSWFRRFLFESIEMDDDDDDDEAESLDELEEFEEFPNFDIPDEVDELPEDDKRFLRWKTKTGARKSKPKSVKPEGRAWEDWLDDGWNQGDNWKQADGNFENGWYEASSSWDQGGVPRDPATKPERGMKRNFKELLFRILEPEDEVEDDLLFEERVFRFTSRTTAKFVGVLIVVPWMTDFVIHDYVLLPFLKMYVEKVPLAARLLDVRESQKLLMIKELKMEQQRLKLYAEIGRAPALSDEELHEHLHEEALELRDEYRLENRAAFASIWSDFTAGLTILLLLILNPKLVGIMRLTGQRLFTNVSDTGKAFIIILFTDIFLGYHSASGWETVIEIILEHYGFEVQEWTIYAFVAVVPVTIDACFKLWVFQFFRNYSPSASATFQEMQRH